MNWEALGATAELLGAIGVIATLVYLAVQIRQNSHQLRGTATTAVYEYQRTLTEMLSADPELYKIALRGNEDLSSLSAWEQQRFTIWAIHETGMWEMCHRLLKQGALDEELYHGVYSRVCSRRTRLRSIRVGTATPRRSTPLPMYATCSAG